jgi:hypothetical protein
MDLDIVLDGRAGTSLRRNQQAVSALTTFVEQYGHARVRPHEVVDGYQLGHWVTYVRARGRDHKVAADLYQWLDSQPGWEWGPLAPGPVGKQDRNAGVLARREEGATLGEIAVEFGISRQRVHQIVQRDTAGK